LDVRELLSTGVFLEQPLQIIGTPSDNQQDVPGPPASPCVEIGCDRLVSQDSQRPGASVLLPRDGAPNAAIPVHADQSYSRREYVDAIDPLVPFSLRQLTEQQRAALAGDLEHAQREQLSLLPKQDLVHAGWQVHHAYLPASPVGVGGDFCSVVTRNREIDNFDFLLGDVSGKGVTASLYMAWLSGLFRSLIDQALPLDQMAERANLFFSERLTTEYSHFATLVCGRAEHTGRVEICNAGHCYPLVIDERQVVPVKSTGIPIGADSGSSYATFRVRLSPGHTLFLYSDGLTEASDEAGKFYGTERLTRLLEGLRECRPATLAAACLSDVREFQKGTPQSDDLTIMVLRRLS
jgi:phosphoserine phosphatase RsbU/P